MYKGILIWPLVPVIATAQSFRACERCPRVNMSYVTHVP